MDVHDGTGRLRLGGSPASGLLIVRDLARDWGVERLPVGVVWAEVPVDSEPGSLRHGTPQAGEQS